MFLWPGLWLSIVMVSPHSIFYGRLLLSLLEKKLATILKTLLVLEAIAKVAFIVDDNVMQRGTLLQPRRFNYGYVY